MVVVRRRFLLVLLVIGQLFVAVVLSSGELMQSQRHKTINELKSEYLNNEEMLWQQIRRVFDDSPNIDDEKFVNETTTDVLKIHQRIFFENTFESNSYWRSYLLYRIDNFRNYLSNLNETLEDNYKYLFDDNEQINYNPSNIELWTRDAMFRRLRENSDGLYDLTVFHNDTVFQVIQNEAKCCIRYVNYVISEARLVREYYTNVAKALIRGHAMTQLAYMLKSLSMHRNFYTDATIERKQFLEHYTEFQIVMQEMLNAASLDLWKCNPNPYLDSHSYYTSITNFMQGYLDNEINLNGEQKCDGTCSDYKRTRNNHECQNDTLCAHSNFARTRCTGDIFDCNTIGDGFACLVKDELENRRYNYATFTNGTMNGHNVLCFKAEKSVFASRSERLPNECENCFCYCDEPDSGTSDRYFSLREVTSDIGANKIVTGIGLKKINRVIQFTISERELFAYGEVNDTLRRTQVWKDSSDMAFLSDGQNGIDYFTLTREARSINLDSIVLPSDKVVTGVRFGIDSDSRLHLELRATEFDFTNGKLKNLEQSVWIKNNLPNEQRKKIEIMDPDSPTRSTNIQERFDSDNKFIEFRSTEIKKDLAQLTIPYIETVSLEASEPKALSGAGIYYKGEYGYGGFLAIKLIAFDTRVI